MTVTEERKWMAQFGFALKTAFVMWKYVKSSHIESKAKDFLMALYFLKSNATEKQIGAMFGGLNEETVRYWVWIHLNWIADFAPQLVSFI